MPLYEFQCTECGEVVELLLKLRARPPKCEECGGRLAKKVSAPAFQFKGSGWYVTDYAGKGAEKDSSKADDSATSSDEKSSDDSPAKDDAKSKGESSSSSSADGDKPSKGSKSSGTETKGTKKTSDKST